MAIRQPEAEALEETSHREGRGSFAVVDSFVAR